MTFNFSNAPRNFCYFCKKEIEWMKGESIEIDGEHKTVCQKCVEVNKGKITIKTSVNNVKIKADKIVFKT